MESVSRDRWLALTYAATIFTSAFLLFQIQPMASKAILPWFGGTPAVWTVCLLFFQMLLFAGYAYAHFSNTFLRPRQQAVLHIAVIVVSLVLVVLLRVLPDARWQPRGDADPTLSILVILSCTIGLPYFVLSATGPLLQAWFARSFPDRTPYRLYALSNAGSLLALVSYPFLFELMFDLSAQARMWAGAFVAFGLLCGYAAWRLGRSSLFGRGQSGGALGVAGVEALPSPQRRDDSGGSPAARPQAPAPSPQPSPEGRGRKPHYRDYLLWLLLPAFASATLMATTNHISTDVAVVPLLWVVPLALYLVTFIVAFDRPRWYRPTIIAIPTLAAVYFTALASKYTMEPIRLFKAGITGRVARSVAEFFDVSTTAADGAVIGPTLEIDMVGAVVANLAAMFGVCLLCHGELARLKPAPRYLTAFYLSLSAGGALGGLAVSIIAPHVFDTVFEWKLTTFVGAIGAIGLILYAVVGRAVSPDEADGRPARSAFASRLLLVVLLLPTALVLLDLVEFLQAPPAGDLYRSRNFFGTLTVREKDASDERARSLVLLNGSTIHGSQYTAPDLRGQPTSYYGTMSGVGRVMNYFRAYRPPGGIRVGDVGLGTGTLAAYTTKFDKIRFFEINPAVVDLATSGKSFTYIPDCRARGAQCEIELGDARLSLAREVEAKNVLPYHVLVLDAFSGDAVPTHLLTAEAMKIYLPRITAAAKDGVDGALIVHVSNRYLDLDRVVRGAAEQIGLDFVQIHSNRDPAHLLNSADWMILSRNAELLAALRPFAVKDAAPEPPVVWTDARSSLFEILK